MSASIVAATLVLALRVQAMQPTALDDFLKGLHTLTADFRQVLRDGQGRVIEESHGTLVIDRPNRFRWDYEAPHKQVIVADGSKLWFYDVDLEQVTVRPLEQSLTGTPAVLLSGGGDIRDAFKIERVERHGKTSAVVLVPKHSDTDFKQVRIRFEGNRLDSMELLDKLGQSTLLEFAHVERNPPLTDDCCAFVPPPGVDVIGNVDTQRSADESAASQKAH